MPLLPSSARPRVFVFNGDADGIVAQHILELHGGGPSLRVTGWKRDIRLLRKLPPMEDGDLHVFDISLRQNQAELPPLLAREGMRVTWYDHHDAGDLPDHPRLTRHISAARQTCTAVLVNAVCGGEYPLWAALAAFGDNMEVTGEALLRAAGLDPAEWPRLQRAGVLVNYNAYGERPGDARFEPAEVALRIAPFASPLDFCRECDILPALEAQFAEDVGRCREMRPLPGEAGSAAFLLPDEPWARRYGATWANARIQSIPGEALALIQPREDGTYLVSIRAPLRSEAPSAADLAGEFPTGGGRKLAAGINHLAAGDLPGFLKRFGEFFRT